MHRVNDALQSVEAECASDELQIANVVRERLARPLIVRLVNIAVHYAG